MKKLILLVIFLLCFAGKCNINESSQTKYVFERLYNSKQEQLSLTDIKEQSNMYHLDRIPLNEWTSTKYDYDKGFIMQRMLVAQNDSLRIVFMYNTFSSIDSTYWQLKIRTTKLK